MRFVFTWLLLLFFSHSVIGQGPINLIDPTPVLDSDASSAGLSSSLGGALKTLPVNKAVSSILEEETEDEREIRELSLRRQQAEQIIDLERRQAELERIEQSETLRQNRLARRQANEVGADLFYFPRLTGQLLKDGWCQLFDGHTSFGWEIQTEGDYGGGKFTFGHHEICSDPYHPGMVYTKIPFGDVSLQFDYWAETDSKALLLLKTPPDPADLNKDCYTFVLNSPLSDRPRGLLLGRHGLAFSELRAMYESWDAPTSQKEETWHSIRVVTDGHSIQVWMDKRPPMTFFVDKPILSGHIAFLVTKGTVRFQNILWQPNRAVAIFDTDNLAGEIPWRLSEKGEVTGNDNTGFRLLAGSIESKQVYDNHMLQMQYYQGANSGRSSLFLRSLPGQKDTGYEISLQNFPTRKDRETARGVDAGGFPPLEDARYIRAQDQQWTYLTVVAMNRQIQTWVNGVPVCEFMDRRNVRENIPANQVDRRFDPFLKPGTIRFSVPQDNTNFQFRRLTVSSVTP